MEQTRLVSLVESVMNTAVGFFISLSVWIWIVVPLWNIPVTPLDNLAITGIFTVSSILRAYGIRRFFNSYWDTFIEYCADKIRGVLLDENVSGSK